MEVTSYGFLFIAGGILGLVSTWLLSKTPEPASNLPKENLLKLFKKPLADTNFRNLLIFNSFWAFALNIATPFFTVYMMRTLHLPLSYIICFAVIGQIAGIFAVKFWGKHSDGYSNKTIIKIAAPLYIICILAWPFAGMSSNSSITLLLVASINILSGISTSGINLALNNIGIKLAPKNEAIVYISAKNMIVAFVSATGPLLGGFFADFFSNRSFIWKIQWDGPNDSSMIRLLELHNLGFLFVIGGLLALVSLRTLHFVKEEGEIAKDIAIAELKTGLKVQIKDKLKKEAILSLLYSPVTFHKLVHKKIRRKLNYRVINMKKWRAALNEKRIA